MGAYDDLVPKAATSPPPAAGGYGDLVPKAKAKASASGGYADLIPKGGAAPAADPLAGAQRAVGDFGKKAGKAIGGALVYGHKHPFDAFLGVTQAPQRALQAFETGGDIGHAFTHPGDAPALSNEIKKLTGVQALENGPLAGSDLPHKLARGAVDFALDFNDPLTVLPVGKGARLATKIPGARKLVEGAAQKIGDSPVGRLLNPDEYLRGLTEPAKAQYEAVTNRAMEAVRHRKLAEDAVVKQHAAQIRAGVMPPEVARLFTGDKTMGAMDAWKQYFPEGLKPGTRPQDVIRALYRNRAPAFKGQVMAELEKAGFFTSPEGLRAKRAMGGTDHFTASIDELPETQARLTRNVEHKVAPESDNVFVRGAQALTHRGNQAFLANPIPHTFNLANLSYNRYGVPTTAKGLLNAGRVAFDQTGGHLGKNIEELKSLGAHSQYGNLFDELGLTKILGIPHTEPLARAANKAIIPLEKFSNYAQHKVLNATETGLRAAALDAEKKGGHVGEDAAKRIHATFGTDAPNKVAMGAAGIGTPFARFHFQTAPGSALKTLAANPGRVTNVVKANRDFNQQVNPHSPQYRSSVPGMTAARLLMDPEGYASNLGPLAALNAPFGAIENLKKGRVDKVLDSTASRFTPGSAEFGALLEMARKKKGKANETALQDLLSALAGGYWVKP